MGMRRLPVEIVTSGIRGAGLQGNGGWQHGSSLGWKAQIHSQPFEQSGKKRLPQSEGMHRGGSVQECLSPRGAQTPKTNGSDKENGYPSNPAVLLNRTASEGQFLRKPQSPGRRQTSLSQAMMSGDDMKERLSPQKTLKNSQSAGQLMTGVDPQAVATKLLKESTLTGDMRSGAEMRESLQHKPGMRSPNNRNRSPSPNTEMLSPRSPYSPGTLFSPREGSWISGSPRSFRGMSPTPSSQGWMSPGRSQVSGSWTPRAKQWPRSVQESVFGNGCSGRWSPRSAEDHLWRELFHEEVEERPQIRLRNEGESIGARGKSSEGIPFRQVPTYNKQGSISRTGDRYGSNGDDPVIRSGIDLPGKRKGAMSPKHWAGNAMKRLLSPVTEGALISPPTPSSNYWLNGPDPEEADKYRPQLKGVSTDPVDPRIASPYPRDDDARPKTAPPQRLRSAPAWFQAETLPLEDELQPAEHVEEARRDWRYIQEKPQNDESKYVPNYMQMTLSRSLSSRSLTSISGISLRSAKSNASTYEPPVHSVRQRGPENSRPRWK